MGNQPMKAISLANVVIPLALAMTLVSAPVFAQQTPAAPTRLSVRPHEMATGTRNAEVGIQQLTSLPDFFVYVPEKAVGTRRVPLVVLLPGGGETSQFVLNEREHWVRQISDTYGMILLVANAATNDGSWDVINGLSQSGGSETIEQADGASYRVSNFRQNPDVQRIDTALKEVLRKYAIDPNRIAIGGMSNGADYAEFLGRSNLDVFSRVGAMSALIPFYGTGPQNPKAQFLVSGAIAERRGHMVEQTMRVAQELRREGHPVETVLCLRGHVDYEPDYEYMWRWLATSWGVPGAPAPAPPPPPADSDPVLTVNALTKMTTFWTRFMREPDSIKTTGRLAHQVPTRMSIGTQPVTVVHTNMRVLATMYPSVAADLQQAGLTARQEDAYRVAIIRVGFTRQAGTLAGPIAETSVLGKNLAFRNAQDTAFKELAKTGMWITQ